MVWPTTDLTSAAFVSKVGRHRHRFPRVVFCAQVGQLLIDELHGIRAEEQVRGRGVAVHELDDRLSELRRVADLLAAHGLASGAAGVHQSVVVGDGARRAVHRAAGPVGAERAGLDGRHANAKILHFLAEGFGQALQRELGAVIEAQAGQRDDAAHRRDVHDVAGATLAHLGQYGLGDGDRAEDVHFELAPQILEGRLFESPFVAVAGVVHEDFDWTDVALDAIDGGLDLGGVGHVEDDANRAGRRRKGFALFLIAQRADDAVAGGARGVGDGSAEARAHARDQPDFHPISSGMSRRQL